MPRADETNTDARTAIAGRIAEIRGVDFTASRRGYDREEVQRYLGALADWLEGLGLGDPDRGDMRRELAWVGERTAEILTKAEETGLELRQSAKADAERLRSEAAEDAERIRLEASSHAEEAVAEAERRAATLLEESARRRQDLQVLIGDLLERRDEIIADGNRLAEELTDLFAAYDDEVGEAEADVVDDDGVDVVDEAEADEEGELAAEWPDAEEQPSSAR